MQTTINQLISILRTGQPLGGMRQDQTREDAVMYYYKDGVFYQGTYPTPTDNDTELTEEQLRARLEAHMNSLSEEELAEDSAHIERMFNSLQTQAVRTAEAIPNPFGMEGSFNLAQMMEDGMPTTERSEVTLSIEEVYSILHVMDGGEVGLFLEDDEEARALIKKLYNSLPLYRQKDIQELELYEDMIEE
jgi:hypothetical protein